MATQFIINDKGERTGVVISVKEYEEMLHQHHFNLQLTDEYKLMMDSMIAREERGEVIYKSLEEIKARFGR